MGGTSGTIQQYLLCIRMGDIFISWFRSGSLFLKLGIGSISSSFISDTFHDIKVLFIVLFSSSHISNLYSFTKILCTISLLIIIIFILIRGHIMTNKMYIEI